MSDRVELTLVNLLDKLVNEIRSPGGPGATTKSFNETLTVEFRANGGVLSGELAAQAQLLLLTTAR